MFSKIMVPLDGSKQAEAALEYACDLARKYTASLHLIRVCWGPMQVLLEGEPTLNRPESLQQEEESAKNYLHKLQESLRVQGQVATVEQVTGDPAECIIDSVAQQGIDLIVITSRGRTGLKRFLMGSVAERVARHAGCPVLIVGR
jgi:nucleotide-binding universal stress UspA family protein